MPTAGVKRNRVSNPKKGDVQKDCGDGGCTVVGERRGEIAKKAGGEGSQDISTLRIIG